MGALDNCPASTPENVPHTVAITGSTGLVGRALCDELTRQGFHVIRLIRGSVMGEDQRFWAPTEPSPDLLKDIDAVLHLAGENTEGLWTTAKKKRIRDSRVIPTRKLAELAAVTPSVKVFICASAVGIYGTDRGAEVLTEATLPGDTFFAQVVRKWEQACEPAAQAGKRVVNVRTGVVLSGQGGILPLLARIFEAGGGGPIGVEQRWMSWIDLDDLVRIYMTALTCPNLHGPINGVSPEPVTIAHFTKALGVNLDRPTAFILPRAGYAMVLGFQGARQISVANQRVQPRILMDLPQGGFYFIYRTIEQCLYHQLTEPQQS